MAAPMDTKSTEANFVPEKHWGLAKLNAVELMALVVGVALCSIGTIGVIIGVPMALGALYSGFFVVPRLTRGLYLGKCPHCGAAISAMHYQEQVDCPSCTGLVRIKDNHFVAVPGSVGNAA